MNDPQPTSPRRRLQALLAIPDNQRTEAQWDEIIELEITLAPGNREDQLGREPRPMPGQKPARPQHGRGGNPRSGNAPRPNGNPQQQQTQQQPQQQQQPKKPFNKKPRRKPPKDAAPE